MPLGPSLCLSDVVSKHPAASLQTVLWSQVSWKPGNWKLSLGTLSTDKLFVQRTWTGQWTQYASFYLVPDRNNSFYLGDSGLHCQLHGVEGVNQPQVARAEPLQRSFKFSNLKFTGCGCLNSQESTSPLLMHTALMALALCVQCALTRFQRSTHSNADLHRSIHFMLFRTGGFDGIWQNQEWLP